MDSCFDYSPRRINSLHNAHEENLVDLQWIVKKVNFTVYFLLFTTWIVFYFAYKGGCPFGRNISFFPIFPFLLPALWLLSLSSIVTHCNYYCPISVFNLLSKLYFVKILGAVWYDILSNSFQFLNNITRIFTHFFTHVFPKNINNVTRTTLPNRP